MLIVSCCFLQILTVAVLAIVLTAPLGALATSLLGPVLLTKASKEELDKIDIKPSKTIISVVVK